LQDAHTVEVSVPRKTDYSFYAVFDGHGGSYIAKVAAETLLDRIMDQPAFERADESPEFLKTAMIEGFKVLDYEMRQVRGTARGVAF
jgi:protein phosphatase 2C family protein 2/3